MKKDSHSQTVRTIPGSHQKSPEKQSKKKEQLLSTENYMKKHRINNIVVNVLPHPKAVAWNNW